MSLINPLMLISIGSVVMLLCLTNSISTLGHNIPQQNIINDYIAGIFCAFAVGLIIIALPFNVIHKLALFNLWLAKAFVTLGFMLLYEANYDSLDSYSYFRRPINPSFDWTGFKIGLGTENIYNLVWLYYRVMPESFHALKVSFALVGLVAVYVFYCAATMFLQKEDIRILYAIGFLPSILFWSSIIGKDPIVILGISLYVYGVVGWYRFKQFHYLLILALGVLIAALIRSWLGLILLAPMALGIVRSVRGIFPKIILSVVMSGALLLAWGSLQAQFRIESYQDTLQTLNTNSRGWSEGGSGQKITADFTKPDQVLAFIPLGMFTALFRPLPGEVMNPFGLMAGLENLLLLVMLGLALIRTRWQDLKDPLVQWAILFVLIWATVYGFFSYQNLGTAVRFKLQVLPVLLGLLLYLGRQRPTITRTIYY